MAMLAAELGFRGWPSASAGPTVMSGASGDGGSLLGRPPPFEPQVYGENIAVDGAGREINGVLAVATDDWDEQSETTTHKSNCPPGVTVRIWLQGRARGG